MSNTEVRPPERKPGSISHQLMRVVFALYCVIALIVTLIHMVQEYRYTQDQVRQELASYQNIFGEVLSEAMWNLDRKRIRAIVDGMIQVPVITGVSIERNQQGRMVPMSQRGTVVRGESTVLVDASGDRQALDLSVDDLLVYEFAISYQVDETLIRMGTARIYASNDVVFDRVRLGFIFLLVNAVIKGVALWLIFLWASKRMLLRPLERLITHMQQLKFDRLDEHKVDLRLKQENELSQVEQTFSNTLQALADARKEILHLNAGLAAQVQERTEALVYAQTLAAASSQAKNDFLTKMSHELRTPLHGLMGMLNLLQEEPLNDMQMRKVRLAKESAEALEQLINVTLDFSRVQAHRLDLEVQEVDIVRIVSEVCESQRQQVDRKSLEIILDLADVTEPKAKGDASRIRQVMQNLVANAVKYTERGHIVVTASQHRVGERVMLNVSVEDTGIGISENNQGAIFEPFTQVDEGTTRRYEGAGLGLAISRRLCQLMQGDITVSSTPGEGCRFDATMFLEPSEQKNKQDWSQGLQGLSILLLVQSPVGQRVLSRQLRAWGAKVDTLGTMVSEQDLETLVSDCQYNAVIVDASMNHACMLVELLKVHLADQSPEWVILQSDRDDTDAIMALNLDAVSTIAKPVIPEDLFRALVLYSEPDECEGPQRRVTSVEREPTAREQTTWPPHTRILVVEDNIVNQHVAKGLLEAMGLSADLAENGVHALERMREAEADRPYTLVLMDCQMPEMDGYECTRAIRRGDAGERYAQVTIVALTANAMKGDRELCLAAGMDDYLAKPIDPAVLRQIMEHWLLSVIDS